MQFPKETTPGTKAFLSANDVFLEAGHVCIKKNTAEKIFGTDNVALSVYYPKERLFMVAPLSESLFKTVHKAKQQMLKMKNAQGDRSVSIQELLLDHDDIDEGARTLEFTAEETLHILKIKL